MPAKLFCKTGELAGSEFFIETEAAIGKNTSNQIVLSPTIISTNHARIFFDEDQKCYFLEDLKSRNGTKLDGMKVTDKEKLGPLHIITFSDSYDFIFQVVGKRVSGPPEVPKSVAPVAAAGTIADYDSPLIAPQSQPAGGRSKTMLDAELPSIPQLVVGDQTKGKTKLETDMPSMPPSLEKGGLRTAPKTMMDPDVPVVPKMSPGGVGSKTVFDQEAPAVPKFSPHAQQSQRPDSGPPTLHHQEVPVVPKMSPSLKAEPPAAVPSSTPQQAYALHLERQNISFTLQEGENIIGRKRKLAIFIDHSTVSRRHAVLRLKSGKVTVEDLGSSNHTFVDGRQIRSEEEVGPHNKMRFGSVEAKLILQ